MDRFVDFLKDAVKWNDSYKALLDDIYAKCKTCKMFRKASPCPVCSLPVAADFSEVLIMDLKEYTIGSNIKYTLHMIDAFTRFSVSTFLSRKLEKVLSRWVSIFGRPKRIWTNLGREFNNKEIQEMSEAVGVELGSDAGMAPWMNG